MSARATSEKRGEKVDGQVIRSVRFDRRNAKIAHNASDVVVLGDSRFLFCDNNVSSALFELRPGPAGRLTRPIVEHPIRGVRPEAIDDMECMTKAAVNGEGLLFISSSLSLKNGKSKKKSRRGKVSAARESLIRMRLSPGGDAEAEIIPCFRAWLVENAPVLGKAAKRLPDEGGLNVEGLAWDPTQNSLLFGLRTPTKNGRPVVLRVQVKKPTGIWNLSNLQMSRPVTLAIKSTGGEVGIRAITWDVSRKVFLVLVGNAISGKKAPFALYSWDGNTRGIVHKFEHVRFHKKMRPEGITHGTIGGRGVVLFVDDNGGYQFLWDTDPRLRREAATKVRAAARTVARGRAKAMVRARTMRVTRRAPAAGARARV